MSAQTRVVFIDQSGDAIGGAERSLELLLGHLSSAFSVSVILFDDGSFAKGLRAAGHRVEVLAIPRSISGIKRENVGLRSALPSLRTVARLRGIVRRLQPDIVYTNTLKAHVLGSIAARSLDVASVAHLRDLLDGRAREMVRLTLRACGSERIAITTAVSEAFGLPRTTVVHNPIDLRAYDGLPSRRQARAILGLPENPPIVGIVGRLNRWKGQDRFLRIAERVAARSDAHFAIVGEPIFRDADFPDELRRIARDLGIEDRTHFVPWLPDPRVAYAAIDINCNTSTREPFGRTLLEAAAAGVPSVCFDDGGSAEAIAPSQRSKVLPQGDLSGFAREILTYLDDPGLLAAAGRDAREHARRFDVSEHAERVGAILHRVAGSNRRAKRTTCPRS